MHWPGRIIGQSMQIEFSYLPVTSEMQHPASLSELWCFFLVEARKFDGRCALPGLTSKVVSPRFFHFVSYSFSFIYYS